MTEKEKMLSGEAYTCLDPELDLLRKKAGRLCKDFNDCYPDETGKRNAVLKEIFCLKEDPSFEIAGPLQLEYGFPVTIGKNVYINHNIYFNDNGGITIGDYTMIGANCSVLTAVHPLSAEERIYALPSRIRKWEKAKKVTIGSRCWIGANVTILPGVTIGDEAVIGAGSVVTEDIPSGVIACGNPCRVLRKIEIDEGQ